MSQIYKDIRNIKTMIISQATFICSSTKLSQCPKPDKPEYAFIGRSNVGKSSLINALTNDKSLAKTSSTPGKTKLINHFLINNQWFLVDLPGLGYAKISKTLRAEWEKMIYDYFLKRSNLFCTFLLIDSRIEPQKIDLNLIDWFGANHIPFALVFTKIDKISRVQVDKNVELFKQALHENWEELPDIFITSAEKKTGLEDILSFIQKTNSTYFFNKTP
ncbi:MAG: YihA family ribosome biogenesis GTP-binding protein [Bacteroidales bacterium]|nr:YihA family ribosome biogenesis GTP-binding protein [Bacteroidales bacterium]